VLSSGPVARDVSASFDLYWNSALSYPITTLMEDLPSAEQARQRKEEFDRFIAEQYESEYLQHLRNSNLAQQLKQQA